MYMVAWLDPTFWMIFTILVIFLVILLVLVSMVVKTQVSNPIVNEEPDFISPDSTSTDL